MTEIAQSEQRKVARRAADWRVLFGPSGHLGFGHLADLSPNGICVVTQQQLSTGTEIEVHFGVEENVVRGKLRMRGVVRHCGGGKIGVQFLDAQPTQRDHW